MANTNVFERATTLTLNFVTLDLTVAMPYNYHVCPEFVTKTLNKFSKIDLD